jgi:hypothetical protein
METLGGLATMRIASVGSVPPPQTLRRTSALMPVHTRAYYAGDVWVRDEEYAVQWHDATHLRHFALCAGALYCWHAGDSAELFRRNPIREEYLIANGGMLADTGARTYKLT